MTDAVAAARAPRSVVRRLMLWITLSIVAGTTVAVTAFAALETRQRSAELNRAADAAVSELALLVEAPLWDIDLERAARLGEAFAEDPRIVRLTIQEATTGETRLIAHGAIADTVSRVRSVTHAGRVIGQVGLVLSRTPMRQEIRAQIWGAIRASLVALLVAFVVVWLVVRRLLDEPLAELSQIVSTYSSGDYSLVHPATPYREFQPFRAVLDTMGRRIVEQLRELQATNQRLSSEVESRQQTEEALRRSRNLEIQVINSVPQGIFWKDLEGRYLGANVVFARAIGAGSVSEVVGRTDFELPHSRGMADHFKDVDQEVISRNQPLRHMVDHVVDAGGASRWIDTTKVPLADGSGHVFGVLGVSEDITERKHADEVLRRRNRDLAALNRFLDLAATEVPTDDLCHHACAELAAVLDVPIAAAGLLDDARTFFTVLGVRGLPNEDDLLGRRLDVDTLPLFDEMRGGRGALAIADAVDDPRLAGVAPLLREAKVASLLALPLVVDGMLSGGVVLASTERREFAAEDVALALSLVTQVAGALARWRAHAAEHLLRAAIEQTPDSVLITDTDARIVYVNPAFSAVTGYPREEAIGNTPRLLKSGAHDSAFFVAMWSALRAGRTWRGRITNRKRDGSDFVEDAILAPVRDESGEITNFVAVKRDITRELEREEQLRHAQRMEAVGQLAGGIAHDFNNILGAITMELELLEMEQDLTEEVRTVARDVRASAQRAANLTRQLLMFSRRQVMSMRPHDLNALINDLMRMLTRLLGERITVEFVPWPTPVVFEGDAGMIEQVIVNLCVNARDAMPNGGVLRVTTCLVQITAAQLPPHEVATPGRFVCAEVTDTGHGMTPETMRRIFEPFFTTKDVGQGTGLGLATAHGLVAQHGGWITVDSTVDRGTTFKVYLPAAASAVPEAAPAPPPVRGGSATVLLVEDEDAVRQVLARSLRRLGYRVVEATNGVDALRAWAEERDGVELLITDMVMPEHLSGLDLAVQLRSRKPSLKVVVMSGYDVRLVGDNAGIVDAIDFLEKPFSLTTLGEMVTRVLGRADDAE